MEGLQEQLEVLSKNLEDKTGVKVAEAIRALEDKFEGNEAQKKEAFELELKGIKESLEGLATKNDVEEVQKFADTLNMKMEEKKTVSATEDVDFTYDFKSKVEENIKNIERVMKGQSVKFDLDVKDMTLGSNLTGDQPRQYSNNVAAVPSQLVNFVDLIGPSIQIDGGTYTFPREGSKTGSVAIQTEGANKSINDYNLTMVDVNTDFLAGYSRYSKKMRNNLPFLQSFVPRALQRDYMKAENSEFYTTLSTGATASAQVITGQNKVEMLIQEIATLEGLDYSTNGIAVRPADWYDIAVTEKSAGSGYGLPGIVNISNGVLTVNGIPVFKANWLAANKYFVGDWSTVKKVVTEGLSVEFSEEDGDNFKQNMITARVEAQVGLAIERPDSIIFGDFTAV